MKLEFELYHEVNGVATDLGDFPYSTGIKQRIAKEVHFDSVAIEQSIDEENQDGKSYIVNVDEKKATYVVFIIQATEIEFWQSAKYHSHVYITDENGKRYRLYNSNTEISQVDNGLYSCLFQITTDDDYAFIKGDVL
jgi:hypothetical protein